MLGLAQQVHQQSLRIGDIVFLYSDEGKGGYVFSECSRYVAVLYSACGCIYVDAVPIIWRYSQLFLSMILHFLIWEVSKGIGEFRYKAWQYKNYHVTKSAAIL